MQNVYSVYQSPHPAHNLHKTTNLADFDAALPMILKLPSNQWWTVKLNWINILNRISNVKKESSTHAIWVNEEKDGGGLHQKQYFLSSYADCIESLEDLIAGLEHIIPEKEKKNIIFKLHLGKVNLTVLDGELCLSERIASALGLLKHGIHLHGNVYMYPGIGEAGQIYAGEKSNITLLGNQFLYMKLDIMKPIVFGRHIFPIAATMCLDVLRSNTSNLCDELYIRYENKGSALHDLCFNEIQKINVQLFDEDDELIKFCQTHRDQPCFELELEFCKGTNLYSLF